MSFMNVKLREGSALAQLAEQARRKGSVMTISERIHVIAERYDALMEAVPTAYRLSDEEMAMFVAAIRDWPLPSVTSPDFRRRIMARVAGYGAGLNWNETKALVDRVETMALSALILAIEQAEL